MRFLIKLNKYLMAFTVFVFMLAVSACDYIPHEVYEIETTSGEIIKLSCPKLEPARPGITYLYRKECYVVD